MDVIPDATDFLFKTSHLGETWASALHWKLLLTVLMLNYSLMGDFCLLFLYFESQQLRFQDIWDTSEIIPFNTTAATTACGINFLCRQ